MSRVPVLRYLPGERIQCSEPPVDENPARGIGMGLAISLAFWLVTLIIAFVAIWSR